MKKVRIFVCCLCAMIAIYLFLSKGEYICAVNSKDCRKIVLSPERDVHVETFLKIVDFSRRQNADVCYEIQADCYIYLLQKYSQSEIYKKQVDKEIIHELYGSYASLNCSEIKDYEEADEIYQDVFSLKKE